MKTENLKWLFKDINGAEGYLKTQFNLGEGCINRKVWKFAKIAKKKVLIKVCWGKMSTGKDKYTTIVSSDERIMPSFVFLDKRFAYKIMREEGLKNHATAIVKVVGVKRGIPIFKIWKASNE